MDLSCITDAKKDRPKRLIILGLPKVGKSTFAAGFPNSIFIPIAREEGIDDLDVKTFPVCAKYKDMRECLKTLYKEEHDYKTLNVDSMSTFENILHAELCERDGAESINTVGGGYGKWVDESLLIWQEFIDALDHLRNKKAWQ